MKKFVRLVTLMLVLTMAVSMLAIPAAATTEQVDHCSVEPRGPVLRCPCGGLTVANARKYINGIEYWYGNCDSCGMELIKRV